MTNTPNRDLDMSDVEADALNDPTLDRDCEEGVDCTDLKCPLIHPCCPDGGVHSLQDRRRGVLR